VAIRALLLCKLDQSFISFALFLSHSSRTWSPFPCQVDVVRFVFVSENIIICVSDSFKKAYHLHIKWNMYVLLLSRKSII
jgi:hypothetical protein